SRIPTWIPLAKRPCWKRSTSCARHAGQLSLSHTRPTSSVQLISSSSSMRALCSFLDHAMRSWRDWPARVWCLCRVAPRKKLTPPDEYEFPNDRSADRSDRIRELQGASLVRLGRHLHDVRRGWRLGNDGAP